MLVMVMVGNRFDNCVQFSIVGYISPLSAFSQISHRNNGPPSSHVGALNSSW